MIRIMQISFVVVLLLVARQVFYAWLKQPDQLSNYLRQGLNTLLAYFAYVMVGLVVFSRLAGYGFGEQGAPVAVFLVLAGAAYVGVGIGVLWLYLAKGDRARKR